MLRALVALLLAIPQLMPPGMCICQFVPTSEQPAAPTQLPSPGRVTAGHVADRGQKCSCESCRNQASSVDRTDAGEAQGTKRADRDPAKPGPVKHPPGCPAALGAMPTKMLVSAVTVQVDSDAVCYMLTVESALAVARATAWVSPQTGDPPLFISHCTLLI